ncbi:MAG: polysaccharide deacetylase family protein [Candidatus Hydrogenedentota bacterium]
MKFHLINVYSLLIMSVLFVGCGPADDSTEGESPEAETVAEAPSEPTWAERLGFPEGTRALILHVDDAGMSHDSNVGTWRAIDDGAANSVSIMMPCPWVPEFAKYVRENPTVDAGLHLTLTSEWNFLRWPPLAGKPVVPGLTDEQGCLWDNVPLVIEHATPDEVEIEIRAQIERARNLGFEPTHMDSHMGTLFAHMPFLERYIKVGIEEQIPVMFPAGHNKYVGRNPERRTEEFMAYGQQIWDGGLPVLDDLHSSSYDWKSDDKVDEYVEAIRGLGPGVTMMILHCTDTFENFDEISSSGDLRRGDLDAMLDPRIQEVIEEEGIVMTTFRELMERRQAVKEADTSDEQE